MKKERYRTASGHHGDPAHSCPSQTQTRDEQDGESYLAQGSDQADDQDLARPTDPLET